MRFNRFVDEDRVSYLHSLVFTFGEFEAADELIELLMPAGRIGEAVIAARHVTAYGSDDALGRLSRRLDTPELLTLAITQLEQHDADPEAAEEGSAAHALAELLYLRGLLDRLLGRANAGDFFASMRAADILLNQGRTDEARRVLSDQAERDGPYGHNARSKAETIGENQT
ncbi:hypothetical protein [Actinoplanes palleronii]|uniref:Tetratricopeptide repeat protein n=1 Tax=Actinoplanes palleronii TaxID=113570 RepID=A0ABQ4BFY0_9ACTN|nr:hypothetical protein [Actinoplanes palleronii]GIE69557.1 hypothetical protein Apa02nite_056650 [Actinoplanes palleronii]